MSDIPELLPHCSQAEDVVLGCILAEPKMVMPICADCQLTGEYFYLPANRLMFEAMYALWARGSNIDFATLAGQLGKDYNDAGGSVRISELSICEVPPRYVGDHIEILQDRFILRKVVEISNDSKKTAVEHGADGKNVLAGVLDALAGVSTPTREKPPSMKELVMDKFRRMDRGEQSENIIKTGFAKLDQHSPLKLGAMPLITGERKSGKSMFALNIAVNVATEKRRRVLYFSLEDSKEEVVDRITAKLSDIPIVRHDKNSLVENDMSKIHIAAEAMATMWMDIRDRISTLDGIVAHIRQYKAEHPELALVVVDYAQLVKVSSQRGVNREQEVALISRTFRLLCLNLGITILLLCQLNKDGETRESKALEQDCTAMWKICAPEEDEPNKRILMIPFQRNGEPNIGFALTLLGHVSRFENYSGEYEPTPTPTPRRR